MFSPEVGTYGCQNDGLGELNTIEIKLGEGRRVC